MAPTPHSLTPPRGGSRVFIAGPRASWLSDQCETESTTVSVEPLSLWVDQPNSLQPTHYPARQPHTHTFYSLCYGHNTLRHVNLCSSLVRLEVMENLLWSTLMHVCTLAPTTVTALYCLLQEHWRLLQSSVSTDCFTGQVNLATNACVQWRSGLFVSHWQWAHNRNTNPVDMLINGKNTQCLVKRDHSWCPHILWLQCIALEKYKPPTLCWVIPKDLYKNQQCPVSIEHMPTVVL